MNLYGLVTSLRTRGVEIIPVDGKLHIAAPAGVLTDDDRALLREHRSEIFELRKRSIFVLEKLSAAISTIQKGSRYDTALDTAETETAGAALEVAVYQYIIGDGAIADVESSFRLWLKTIDVGRSKKRVEQTPELFSL